MSPSALPALIRWGAGVNGVERESRELKVGQMTVCIVRRGGGEEELSSSAFASIIFGKYDHFLRLGYVRLGDGRTFVSSTRHPVNAISFAPETVSKFVVT